MSSYHSSTLPIPDQFLMQLDSSESSASTKQIMRQIEEYHLKTVTMHFLRWVDRVQCSLSEEKGALRQMRIMSRIDLVSSLPQWTHVPAYISSNTDIVGLRVDDDAHLGLFMDKLKNMYDLVVLDSVKSAPYVKARLKQMVRMGIPLEICYGEAMHSDLEFVQFIGRIRMILKYADMRQNIIFSNGYRAIEDYLTLGQDKYGELIKFFSPGDVANLASLYGFRHSVGLRCVSEHVRLALERGITRRGFRGVAEVIKMTDWEAQKKRKFSEYIPKKKPFDKRKRRKQKKALVDGHGGKVSQSVTGTTSTSAST